MAIETNDRERPFDGSVAQGHPIVPGAPARQQGWKQVMFREEKYVVLTVNHRLDHLMGLVSVG